MDFTIIGKEVEAKIIALDKEFDEMGVILTPKEILLRVVGQNSLLADEFLSSKIDLEGTMDLDIFIKGNDSITKLVKEVCKFHQLFIDPLSDQIWMPKETKYEVLFQGDYVTIEKAGAIFVLTSKAVKAKEKNKVLIKNALSVYGKELQELILKYGGDLAYFK